MRKKIIAILFASSCFSYSQTTHIVQRGETFEFIARKHGISVQELKAANPDDEECFTGLKIIIPSQKVVEKKKTSQNLRSKGRNTHRTSSERRTRTRSASSSWNMSNPFNMMFGNVLTPSDPGYFKFDFSTGPDFQFDFSNMPAVPVVPDGVYEGTSSSGYERPPSGSSSINRKACVQCKFTNGKCPVCKGTRKLNGSYAAKIDCNHCGGSGLCPKCNGTGFTN